MVAPVTMQVGRDFEDLLQRATRTWGKDVLFGAILRFFRRQAPLATREVAKQAKEGGRGYPRLERRTGSLMRDLTAQAELFQGVPSIQVGIFKGPSTKYAAVQELGTQGKNEESPFPDITPKNGEALAVPVGPALTPAGVPRYVSARDYPKPLVFAPWFRPYAVGGLYDDASMRREVKAAEKAKRPIDLKNVLLVYMLLRRAQIPAHYFLRTGFRDVFLPRMVAALQEFLARALSRGALE